MRFLTLVLALVLAFTTSLVVAVVALVVVGGPAGVGSSMLYAHLRHSGAKPADIVNTRAIVSVAWIAGPPLATLIIGAFGNRAILLAIGAIAVLVIATTVVMIFQRTAAPDHDEPAKAAAADHLALRKRAVVLIVAAFVLLQAANATVTSIMTLFVTETMRINVIWAGIALGVAAGLEVPALVLIGRLSLRFSSLGLIVTGCVAGIAYYIAMAYVTEPVMLIALQPLNAWCFAAITPGVGLTLFQQMIPRPGLSTGPLHEYQTGRRHRLWTDHRPRLDNCTWKSWHLSLQACGLLMVLALGVIAIAARQEEFTDSRPGSADAEPWLADFRTHRCAASTTADPTPGRLTRALQRQGHA